jgi:hypothetical protein
VKKTDEKIADLKQGIKEDLLTNITANETAITAPDQRINQLEVDIITPKDALEKNGKVNDLKIKGIPVLPNEQSRPLYNILNIAWRQHLRRMFLGLAKKTVR